MSKKVWPYWAAIISVLVVGLVGVEHVVHLLPFLSEEGEKIVAVVGGVIYLISVFLDVRKKIEEQSDKITAKAEEINTKAEGHQQKIIGIVESVTIDVVRKLLEIKIGKDIRDLLLPAEATFPLTLVPGGDIALNVNQQDYAVILQKCVTYLGGKEGWSVDWTTFVPFENLNHGLAYNSDQWARRFHDEWLTTGQDLSFRCPGNNKYYHGISHWASIKNPHQIIVLANPYTHPQHPLNWRKYATPTPPHDGFRGGAYNLDLLKYVMARYGVKTHAEFVRLQETDFAAHHSPAQDADRINEHVKWYALDEVQLEQRLPSFEKLYNLDFVMFRSEGSAFALVRIDPVNYVEVKGGIPGITFIVYTSEMVSFYSALFKIMWTDSKQTFHELTELQM